MLGFIVIVIVVPALFLSANAGIRLNEMDIGKDLMRKMMPLPTIPTEMSRTHRVGAQRFMQFGQRCWHGESCSNCVCCGNCSNALFYCDSPPGTIDFCLLYEKISMHTDLEKQNEMTNHQLPKDFPDV